MIKLVATQKNGRKLIALGLSARNLELLQQDKPIEVMAEELGLSGYDILVFHCKSEQEFADTCVARGLITEKTRVLGDEKPH
jgi:hypothetical protein